MTEATTKSPDVPGSAQGLGGPNPTPTFGNKPQTDNNKPVEEKSELDSFVEGADAATRTNRPIDEILAASSVGDAQEGKVQYAAPNIARLKIGPYQFENGVLRIDEDKQEHFEKLLKTSTARTQQAVHRIDHREGEAVARRFLDQTQGKRTTGVDTTANTVGAPNPSDPANKA